ncbi:MAG: cytochrome c3 family protein [Gammaproteobacteria bacterium]|nr:cytochrome c3 family protein [Gammaproteobacteria bacterium]
MNHFVKAAVATAVVLGTSLVAVSASAGITNTRHNLGATGTGPNHTADTGEICIFCHTPHGGDTGAPVPIWNKKLTTATFTTYDQLGTSTLDAAVGPVGSVSLACLTCHDGTQAIDNILNAPGSGGFDATGGGANGLGWTWTTDGTLDINGTFQGSVDGGGANIWEIGTDLRNDHPVSMQYGGGGYSVSNLNGGGLGATGATRDEDFFPATPIGTAGRWYVDNTVAGTTGSFDKWDFKLYTRDTTGFAANANNGAAFAGEKEPFVECGSCHDPHFETTTFLRMPGTVDLTTALGGGTTSVAAASQSNTGSRVCLTCHNK